MRVLGLAVLLLVSAAAPAATQGGPATDLEFLAGDWTISDASGATGRSHIVVQAPRAMIFELRDVGDGGPLPLWFAYSERTGGWTQLFPSPAGIREFPLQSAPGAWPLVFGGDVRLQDGSPARFRLSLFRPSSGESRRMLEISRDGGATWSTIFEHHYRRIAAAAPAARH